MYTIHDLKQKAEDKGITLDTKTLRDYVKGWKIDPVYEDEKGIEYFDDLAVNKLDEELKNFATAPVMRINNVQTAVQEKGELQNITVDVTSQTLSLLAESIAKKISDDITDKFKESDILEPVLNSGKLRRDNEIMATQIDKLIKDNQKLSVKVELLEKELAKYRQVFGSFYMKSE